MTTTQNPRFLILGSDTDACAPTDYDVYDAYDNGGHR